MSGTWRRIKRAVSVDHNVQPAHIPCFMHIVLYVSLISSGLIVLFVVLALWPDAPRWVAKFINVFALWLFAELGLFDGLGYIVAQARMPGTPFPWLRITYIVVKALLIAFLLACVVLPMVIP